MSGFLADAGDGVCLAAFPLPVGSRCTASAAACSDTTGAMAGELGRKRIAVEAMKDYIEGSKGPLPALLGSGVGVDPELFQRSLNCDCCILPYVGVTALRRSN
jgi:hypothetical protein